ncbi:HAMP domain-containing histidine kinase [bacterium]|nr:HAMP domain-containing histidine kinase [bacterium]
MFIQFSFRTKIILVFSGITIGLVMIMSRMSYYTVREIYLNQLSDQVMLSARIVMSGLNAQHLGYLNPQDNNSFVTSYYTKYLLEQKSTLQLENASIFNEQLQTLVSTDTLNSAGYVEPLLVIQRSLVKNLKERQSVTSMPFKGEDESWYLWGFYRIDESHWLCIRENAHRLARVEQLSIMFWGIGLGGILLTLLGGLFLSRTLARPIEQLVHFSRELGKGEWETPVPTHIKGELSSLAGAMHHMRESLVSRQKEKETILAHIAHEIRNPLGGIELLTGLIKEDVSNREKNMEYTQKILDEIGGLKSLINNYLNFGRPSVPKPENVLVSDVIDEATHVLQNSINEKKVSIECQTIEKMRFDRNHLRHILINLLTNAIQAVNVGGQVSITLQQKSGNKLLEISDDGPGIDESVMRTVFEPFFTTHSNGTGLGLAICKKLCDENGATISVKNNNESGCTFTITVFENNEYS